MGRMTPHSQPRSLVPAGALPSSGLSFWGLKAQGGSGTGTSPASPRLGPGPETPSQPCVPSSGAHLGSCLPSTRCLSFMMLRGHLAPRPPFPGWGSDAPHPQPRLCPQKAGPMVPLCPGATAAPRPSSQGTSPNHRRQPLPSPPLYPSPALHQDSWESRLGLASFLWMTSPCSNGRQLRSGTQCGPQTSSWGA